VHLFNLFSGAGVVPTLLQVVYTTLMGGVFAFVLMKTKNLLCCAFVHALYNFGGLLLDSTQRMGLGSGIIFDLGTVILTVILGICIGAFILYNVYKYSEAERSILYKRLGI
jgi:membrane protease YdiL (CAAX protease family)